MALFSLIAPPMAQAQGPDPRFGLVDAYENSAAATEAGAGFSRIVLRWDVIQPAGRDDWKPANVPDPFIEAELTAGRDLAAVLIGTPNWASQGVNDPRAVPDMEAWGNFVSRVAQQYRGRIKYWVIWNEPDVWDTENPGSTWLGTEADYVRLLKVAYDNIKNVDPDMQVALGGLTWHWDARHGREQYLTRLLNIITADPAAAERRFYFDAVAYHFYYDPREMFDIVTQVRATLDSYGLRKPVWVTQLNAPPTDDPQEPPIGEPAIRVSVAEQANFVIQAYALLAAAGAERVGFYKLRTEADYTAAGLPFGLLRADNSRRPAFGAYQVVTKYFDGYTNYQWVHQGNFYIITLNRRNQTTTVLWNISSADRPFSINAIAAEAILVDETGAEQVIQAANGVYSLVLPGASCGGENCIIGGAPRLLIETGSADERASLIPLATATFTPTPLPTETPTPTGTPTATPSPTITPMPTATAQAVANAEIQPQMPQPQNAAPVKPQSAPDSTPSPQERVITALNPRTLFSPHRILLLVVIGAALFTLFYVVQFRLWHRRR